MDSNQELHGNPTQAMENMCISSRGPSPSRPLAANVVNSANNANFPGSSNNG